MYVCICNAVSDKQIRAKAREGCCSLRQLSRETGCATSCGKCARLAREILDRELERIEQAEGNRPSFPALAYPAA